MLRPVADDAHRVGERGGAVSPGSRLDPDMGLQHRELSGDAPHSRTYAEVASPSGVPIRSSGSRSLHPRPAVGPRRLGLQPVHEGQCQLGGRGQGVGRSVGAVRSTERASSRSAASSPATSGTGST